MSNALGLCVGVQSPHTDATSCSDWVRLSVEKGISWCECWRSELQNNILSTWQHTTTYTHLTASTLHIHCSLHEVLLHSVYLLKQKAFVFSTNAAHPFITHQTGNTNTLALSIHCARASAEDKHHWHISHVAMQATYTNQTTGAHPTVRNDS